MGGRIWPYALEYFAGWHFSRLLAGGWWALGCEFALAFGGGEAGCKGTVQGPVGSKGRSCEAVTLRGLFLFLFFVKERPLRI